MKFRLLICTFVVAGGAMTLVYAQDTAEPVIIVDEVGEVHGFNPARRIIQRVERRTSLLSNAQKKLAEAKTKEDEANAVAEIRESLEKEFQADLDRRQKQLEEIKARLKDLEDVLAKRIEAKNEIIDLRLQVLTTEAKGLGWSDSGVLPAPPLPGTMFRSVYPVDQLLNKPTHLQKTPDSLVP